MRTSHAPRRAHRLMRSSLLAVLVVGCQQVPLATGPRIPIPTAAVGHPASGIQQVAHWGGTGGAISEVLVDDLRPDWEREFRSPAVKPSQYEHAIGFVPLDNLEPAKPFETIVQRIAARTGMKAARAEVELRSYRVVINDVEALRHDHSVLKRVGGDGGFSIGPLKLGLGASISSDPVDVGAFADPVAAQRKRFRPALLRDGQKYLFGPPAELPEHLYQAGVTCEVDATITFVGSRGTRRPFLAQVRTHTPPTDPTATVTHDQLVHTVMTAHSQIESKIATRIAYERGTQP